MSAEWEPSELGVMANRCGCCSYRLPSLHQYSTLQQCTPRVFYAWVWPGLYGKRATVAIAQRYWLLMMWAGGSDSLCFKGLEGLTRMRKNWSSKQPMMWKSCLHSMSVGRSVCLSVCLHLSICLHPSIYIYLCLSVWSVCVCRPASIYLSYLSLCVCPSAWFICVCGYLKQLTILRDFPLLRGGTQQVSCEAAHWHESFSNVG